LFVEFGRAKFTPIDKQGVGNIDLFSRFINRDDRQVTRRPI
jgi:hypothetical protein